MYFSCLEFKEYSWLNDFYNFGDILGQISSNISSQFLLFSISNTYMLNIFTGFLIFLMLFSIFSIFFCLCDLVCAFSTALYSRSLLCLQLCLICCLTYPFTLYFYLLDIIQVWNIHVIISHSFLCQVYSSRFLIPWTY